MKALITARAAAIVILLGVAGWLFVGKKASAEEPRWGRIKYDNNRLEYVLPRCQESKIKRFRITKDGKVVTIRLECDPVPGEVNQPNRDISE